MTPDFAHLDEHLRDWLPQQRWFGGKGRLIDSLTSEVRRVRDGDPAVWVALVRIGYADGTDTTYSVPLTTRTAYDDRVSHALIGEVGGATRMLAFDALQDRDSTPVWGELLGERVDLAWLTFTHSGDVEIPAGVPGDILTSEQSNSSLVYGDVAITKFFRRLEDGTNPDVEIHEALQSADNPHIAGFLGHATVRTESLSATFAMTQQFLPVASDGWSLATASVRDLFAEGDLHADEVGGDFAGEAHRLGAATASVHADLAEVLPTEAAPDTWYAGLAGAMRARLSAAVDVVPDLVRYVPALTSAYDALAADVEPVMLQRVHGDYHLGQVLRTSNGWTLLDFEGEPAKSIPERRRPDCSLRDVAGMLRSFDYASSSRLLSGPAEPQLQYRAVEWSDRNRSAFCDGYAEGAGTDPRDHRVLLAAFEADKAVYEAVYEARHRPEWLTIPLHSLARLEGRAR
ncbi:MAG: maltokinase N-terminal cap-like domain-containing protein [Mycobacteriales bacterium]